MVERHVLIKLKGEHATPEMREEIAIHSRSILGNLEGARGLSVGLPADKASLASWDLSFVLHFESLEATDAYLAAPSYRAFVDEYLEPKSEVIKAWNFEV